MTNLIVLPEMTEKDRTRLVVDSIVGDIDFALEKIKLLMDTLDTDYFEANWADDKCTFESAMRDMFVINSMISDYISDIRDAKEELEDAFVE